MDKLDGLTRVIPRAVWPFMPAPKNAQHNHSPYSRIGNDLVGRNKFLIIINKEEKNLIHIVI